MIQARHGPQHFRSTLLGAVEFILLSRDFRGFFHLLVPLLEAVDHWQVRGQMASWQVKTVEKVRNKSIFKIIFVFFLRSQ